MAGQLPPQNVPVFDVQERVQGFEWLTAWINRRLFSKPWYLFFDWLARNGGGSGTGGVWEQTLASGADPVDPDSSPSIGEPFAASLTQNASGDGYPAWEVTKFATGTPTGVGADADQVTNFMFVGLSDGLWHCTGYFIEP